jgi:hypothetical protein
VGWGGSLRRVRAGERSGRDSRDDRGGNGRKGWVEEGLYRDFLIFILDGQSWFRLLYLRIIKYPELLTNKTHICYFFVCVGGERRGRCLDYSPVLEQPD